MAEFTEDMVESLAREIVGLRSEWEFRTFWLGVRIRGPISREEAIAGRRELRRRLGLRVLELAPDLVATPESPEARLMIHPDDGRVSINVRPLLVYGRYRKLSREIPQSKWPCRCRGRGCELCNYTGKRYERTVEELMAAVLLPLTGAEGTKLHSVGREDVNVRMLGSGRPFVLELARPRVRTIELAPAAAEINRRYHEEMEVREIQPGDAAVLKAVTSARADKTYRAVVECLAPAPVRMVERLSDMAGMTIHQETPRRVLHRRPNRMRPREVRTCSVALQQASEEVRRFVLTLRVESGTYVKELVSGDEGRTNPSVAALLRLPCECAELDVLDVHCDPMGG